MDVDATTHPRFKASLQPIISADDGLFLFCEGRHAWLPNPLYAALARMLDGEHDVETIFISLSASYPVEQVFEALDYLRTSGFLAQDAAAEARATMAFWEHVGVPPSLARSRLAATSVSTVRFGAVELEALTSCLRAQGVRLVPGGDVTVVVTDDYLRSDLAVWNAHSLNSGHPWLLVRPIGIETLIGPMFVPGQTACWDCLAQRLRGHRRVEEYVARRNGIESPIGPPPAGIHSTLHAALGEAATEITRWIGTAGKSTLLDRLVATNILTLERAHHILTRRPQCPSCGSAKQNIGGRPVQLSARPKAHWSDGGHRAFEQREVLNHLERHLSPYTGIISTLSPGERTGVALGTQRRVAPTFAADHSFSDAYDDRVFLREGSRRRAGGKGKSVEQARVSALAESLERYCGVFDGTESRVRATFQELGAAALHPNACMRYSDTQHADRERLNAKAQKASWVPEPFLEDVEIEWTPLWSLSTEEQRYLPTSFCYYGYQTSDPLFARANSNGCAAGAVIEEAVLQGCLELIERDAVALWWYNRLRRPAVDLETFNDPYVAQHTQYYREIRREVWALDITSDIGVPTFAAVSRRIDKAEEDIIYGFGTHLDPSVALTRALTELNQALEAVPAATGPESSRTYRASPEAVNWWRTTKTEDARYLAPHLGVAPRRFADFRGLASNDLREDIAICSEMLARQGIEILVLDQSRPDVGFSVVRVVAPGLRHFWPRFGTGRLYDVPVREGWLPQALDEAELNPFSIEM